MQQKTSALPPACPESINLLGYLEVIARRWRMIARITAVAFIVSLVVAFQFPETYSSTALILPPQQDAGMMGMMSAMTGGVSSLAGDLLGKGTSADLYVGILNSSAVKDAIIDRFELMEVYQQRFRIDAQNVLGSKANIASGKKDGIISITVEDKDPKRAADLANAFVEELGKLTVKLNITGAGQNRGYLEKRLAKAKTDLAGAEEALKLFQSKNKALDVPEQAKASIQSVAQLKAQLAAQEVQLASMRRRFTDSGQDVKDLKTSVVTLRAQLGQVEGEGRGSTILSVGSVPQLGQEYVRLMRELKVQEAIFELLTKQYEMARMSEAKDVDGMQIIQQATVSDKKSKPKRSLIVMATTIFAGLVAVLCSFVQEAWTKLPSEERRRCNEILAIARGAKRGEPEQ